MEISKSLKAIGRPIFYWPTFCKAFGDSKTGIFVSNFLYWEGKQIDPDGWIYKSQKDIFTETGLERSGQEYARRKLKELECLREKKAGVPAKLYYLFDWEEIDKVVFKYLEDTPIKKIKKTPEAKKEREPTLLYQFKEIFDTQYVKVSVGAVYQWSKENGGGKDWKNLKLLMQSIQRAAKLRLEREPTDEESLDTFRKWITKLPKWYEYNAFSPSVMYSKFNEITAAIRQEYKESGSSKEPKDFSRWLNN